VNWDRNELCDEGLPGMKRAYKPVQAIDNAVQSESKQRGPGEARSSGSVGRLIIVSCGWPEWKLTTHGLIGFSAKNRHIGPCPAKHSLSSLTGATAHSQL
jgi:hypothetical protein